MTTKGPLWFVYKFDVKYYSIYGIIVATGNATTIRSVPRQNFASGEKAHGDIP